MPTHLVTHTSSLMYPQKDNEKNGETSQVTCLNCSLSQLVHAPKIVREIDWVNRFWPEHSADERYDL